MKLFSHKKNELKTEVQDELSLEDILAEYQARDEVERDQAMEYSQAGGAVTDWGYQAQESYAPVEEPVSRWGDVGSFDDEDVRVYTPASSGRSNIAAMEQEALRYLEDLRRRADAIPDTPVDDEYSYESSASYSEYAQPQYGYDESAYGYEDAPLTQDYYDQAQPEQYAQSYEPELPVEDGQYGYSTADYDDYMDSPLPEAEPQAEEHIDERFNLSGKYEKTGFYFGGRSVDMSADSSYRPAVQTAYNPSQWVPEQDEQDEQPEPRKVWRKEKKMRQRQSDQERYTSQYETLPRDEYEREYAESFDDRSAAPSDYADSDDYAEEGRRPSRRSRLSDDFDFDAEEGYFPPTFKEYVASLFASAFLRIRGTARGSTANTMSDSEEDLGPELTAAGACKYYGSFVRSQKLRLRISTVLLIILCYITMGLPVPGMLRYIPVAAMACCAIQLTIMLLSLDIVTTGILNIFRPRFGADSLAVVSCLVTTVDALIVALSDSAVPHIPLCAVSSLSLVGVSMASSLNTRALRKAFRVPAIGKNFYSVTGENKLASGDLTLLKSLRSAKGFVRRAEEAPPDETLFNKISLPLLMLAIVLSLVIAAVKKSFSDLVFIFSAVLSPAVPVMALSAFALPFFMGSVRIFKSGVAIAGWSGLCDVGVSRNLIVTDRDLFPESSVEMGDVRIFSDESAEKIIAYAGTMICASGSCISSCFSRLMEENGCALKHVESFEYLSGGGMKGLIDGDVVLCGGTELMRLMNVRIPFRLTDKTSVLLAVNGVLYGIFTLNYKAQPQVRKALVELVRSGRHPIFAVRDFNINPEMLHNTYDIATDGYDFPPYVERFKLSEASSYQETQIAAVICNEGLAPLTQVADVGRSMYIATRFNLVLTALSALIGMLLVFIKLLTVGSVSASFLLLFMLAWAIPVVAAGLFVGLGKH